MLRFHGAAQAWAFLAPLHRDAMHPMRESGFLCLFGRSKLFVDAQKLFVDAQYRGRRMPNRLRGIRF
jgi:hypothetical protein